MGEIIKGNPDLNKKFLAIIGKLPQGEQGEWKEAIGKAGAAFNIILNWQKSGGMTDDYSAANGGVSAFVLPWQDDPTDDELKRRKIAETRVPITNMGAEQYKSIYEALSSDNGDGTRTLNKKAKAMFEFALNHEMRGQQKVSADIGGRFIDGFRKWWNSSADYLAGSHTPPWLPKASELDAEGLQAVQGNAAYNAESIQIFNDLRDIVKNAESLGSEVSDDVSGLAQALGGIGNIAGQSVPATLAGLAAVFSGGGAFAAWAAGAAAMAPSAIEDNTVHNLGQGYSSPYLTGLVQGLAQGGVENIGSVIPGGGIPTKLLFRIGTKTPMVGRIVAKAQSNSIARYFLSSASESGAEMLEDPLADVLSNGALGLMRRAGVDINAPYADPIATLADNMEDPVQAASIIGYGFALNLLGGGGNAVKARTFARNYDNLKAAGFSRENAAYISQRAEEISNRIAEVQANQETSDSAKTTIIDALEKDFQQEQQNLFKKDVLEQDPSVLLKRAKENKKELMSQREAALLTASGARDAALAKMGVLQEPKPSPTENTSSPSKHRSPTEPRRKPR